MTATILAFLIVTLLVTASGAAAVIRQRETTRDYLVASRDVPPWLAALSTVATNNSGFMFIGMIAATWRTGIDTVWMMVGWTLGDLLMWLWLLPRLRARAGAMDAVTVTAILSTGPEGPRRRLVVLASALTLILLGVYAAAQLKAGATALHAIFGWHVGIGAAIGALIVILYSFAGGIRADIWTDAAQSAVMAGSMLLLLVAGWQEVGGPAELFPALQAQDPALLSIWPEGLLFGPAFFVLGFVAAGLGTLGQPHLMTRIISMDHARSIRAARWWYFGWMVPFWSACIGVGLYARVVLPELASFSAPGVDEPTEFALPLMTAALLPDVFVGIALAGLFAATVSTADSQIILCSGVLTQDMAPRLKDSYVAAKAATVGVLALALLIALWAPEGVFDLVLVAWSGLGATLGPVLAVRLLRWRLPDWCGVAMMAAGLAAVLAWRAAGLSDDVYAILPGIIAAFAARALWVVAVMETPSTE